MRFTVSVVVAVMVTKDDEGTEVDVTVTVEMLVVVSVLTDVEVAVDVVVALLVSVLVTVVVSVEVAEEVTVVVAAGSSAIAASAQFAEELKVAGKSVGEETPATAYCAIPAEPAMEVKPVPSATEEFVETIPKRKTLD